MILTVPRHDEPQFLGLGLLKGLLVTGRHFIRSYQKRRNRHILGQELFPGGRFGIFTVQYPEETGPVPERYRGLPILLYDDETGAELCTACQACARACPLEIIHIEQAVSEEGKKLPYAERFAIEHGVCMNCGLCADACAFGAIVLDHRLETAALRQEALWAEKEQLLHPASYYEALAPTIWAEMKEDALKRLQGTMSRRPQGMGIVKR